MISVKGKMKAHYPNKNETKTTFELCVGKTYKGWEGNITKIQKSSVSKCQLKNVPHHLVPQGLGHWPLWSLTFNTP